MTDMYVYIYSVLLYNYIYVHSFAHSPFIKTKNIQPSIHQSILMHHEASGGWIANLGANNQMCYRNYLVARQCSDSPLSTESPTEAPSSGPLILAPNHRMCVIQIRSPFVHLLLLLVYLSTHLSI